VRAREAGVLPLCKSDGFSNYRPVRKDAKTDIQNQDAIKKLHHCRTHQVASLNHLKWTHFFLLVFLLVCQKYY
jgi:hypothetical protein